MVIEAIADAAADILKILPFLFLTYLAMEYIEHKAKDGAQYLVQKAGRFGPLAGGVLGIFPQCGFSAAASNLYAGRIITLGTLLSVFWSTSDEMLPILISQKAPAGMILRILGIKALIGMAAGMAVDFIVRKRDPGREERHLKIEQMCDHQHCHCGEGKIWRSALRHTLQVALFILAVSLGLNILTGIMGEESIRSALGGRAMAGPVVAGLIGLIPNCAASVTLTQLYLEGLLSAGALISGLLVGAGVGLLILFRVNENLGENLRITALLYAVGVISGIVIEAAGLVF